MHGNTTSNTALVVGSQEFAKHIEKDFPDYALVSLNEDLTGYIFDVIYLTSAIFRVHDCPRIEDLKTHLTAYKGTLQQVRLVYNDTLKCYTIVNLKQVQPK